MRRKAFTLIELLVVIAIIALLISILVPSLARARELARRAACGANLNGIGKAIVLYAGSNSERWPILTGISAKQAVLANNANLYGGSVTSGTQAVNPVDNLQLLVKENMIPWKMLKCPSGASGSDVMDRTATADTYGLKKDTTIYCDYAVQWAADISGTTNPAKLTESLDGGVAIIADKFGSSNGEFKQSSSDTTTGRQDGSGYSHKDDGINVLYASWNVSWSAKSVKAGWGKNNVYTKDMDTANAVSGSDASGTAAMPVSKYDSVLVNPE
jgi:prepilin-type N-terminal cleavage/methylation domain-containing protein